MRYLACRKDRNFSQGFLYGHTTATIHPAPGDTWATIAEAHLPDEDSERAISQLQSWNLHIFARRIAPKPDGSPANPILPSDIVFLEPPLAKP